MIIKQKNTFTRDEHAFSIEKAIEEMTQFKEMTFQLITSISHNSREEPEFHIRDSEHLKPTG